MNLREWIENYLELSHESPFTASYEIMAKVRETIGKFMDKEFDTA